MHGAFCLTRARNRMSKVVTVVLTKSKETKNTWV